MGSALFLSVRFAGHQRTVFPAAAVCITPLYTCTHDHHDAWHSQGAGAGLEHRAVRDQASSPNSRSRQRGKGERLAGSGSGTLRWRHHGAGPEAAPVGKGEHFVRRERQLHLQESRLSAWSPGTALQRRSGGLRSTATCDTAQRAYIQLCPQSAFWENTAVLQAARAALPSVPVDETGVLLAFQLATPLSRA